MCRSKELQIQEADAKVRLQARQTELSSLEHDLRMLKEQNAQQIDETNTRQAEIDALNKHMNLITQQNYELSCELQRFLQTDEVVKTKLNRRTTVDEIRHKVDTAIRRSQKEVEQRRSPAKGHQHSSTTADDQATQQFAYRHRSGERSSGQASRNTASAQGYERGNSPLRSKSPPRMARHHQQ